LTWLLLAALTRQNPGASDRSRSRDVRVDIAAAVALIVAPVLAGLDEARTPARSS
jgi:hypothetical protein